LFPLEVLDLGNNRLSGSALVNIAEAPQLSNLRSLWLEHNTIGMQGIEALVASPILGQLQELRLQGNRLTDKSAAELLKANWPVEFRLMLTRGSVSSDILEELESRYRVTESI